MQRVSPACYLRARRQPVGACGRLLPDVSLLLYSAAPLVLPSHGTEDWLNDTEAFAACDCAVAIVATMVLDTPVVPMAGAALQSAAHASPHTAPRMFTDACACKLCLLKLLTLRPHRCCFSVLPHSPGPHLLFILPWQLLTDCIVQCKVLGCKRRAYQACFCVGVFMKPKRAGKERLLLS